MQYLRNLQETKNLQKKAIEKLNKTFNLPVKDIERECPELTAINTSL